MMHETEKKMVKLANQRSKYLDTGLLKPISENYLFTNAGLYLLIGSIGSGKSYFISRHILYTDQLVNKSTGEKGFYRSIIIVTSGNKSDETTESFLRGVKNSNIVRVHESQAIVFLNELFRVKRKYYTLYKAFMRIQRLG